MNANEATPAVRGASSLLADEVVTLAELSARLGLGPSALRMARRKGLRIRRIGRRKFVLGRDLVAFLEAQT